MSEAATMETTRSTKSDMGTAKSVAVIGAGASGLCTAKHLIEAGLDVTVFEIGTQVGGLWCYNNDSGRSSAYRTLHINTAKNMTNFSDFKFRDEVQRFPSHWDMHAYLREYAEHFGVMDRIEFKSEIKSVTPVFDPGKDDPKWELETVDGRKRTFDNVCVCTGHLTKPLHVPEFQNKFEGEYVHSHYYKEPEPFIGKRICVVGIGNSACDIVSDVCVYAKRCVLVARTGVWIAPKLFFGLAFTDITERFMKRWVPEWFRSRALTFLIWCVHGNMQKLGFPPITQKVHPTSSATIVNDIAYDRIFVKQGIDKVEGKTLHFVDGTAEEFDVLIAATGYLIELPFLSPDIVPIENNGLKLYKRIVPPEWPGLYFVGMANVTTALNVNYEHQTKWVREFILGNAELPSREEMHADIADQDEFIRTNYKATPRHMIEEEHLRYFPQLKKSLKEALARKRRAVPRTA